MKTARGIWLLMLVVTVVLATVRCGPAKEPTPTLTPTPTTAPLATPTPTKTPTPTPTSVLMPVVQQGGMLNTSNYYGRDPSSFDIMRTGSVADGYITALFYNQLLWNPGGQVVECDLCSSWELQDGGKTMVFHLFPGVKFHDGRDLKASDVKWSVERLLGRVDGIEGVRGGALSGYVEAVEASDDRTVVLRLFRPTAVVPRWLALHWAPIYPEGTTPEQLKKGPYGSGAWVLKEWVPGSHVEYARNPSYFKEGRPYLDGVKESIIKEQASREAAFLTGKVDLVEFKTTPDSQKRLRDAVAEGKAVLEEFLSPVFPLGFFYVVTQPPFDDVRVRKAFHLAIDREAMCQTLFDGYCVPEYLYPGGYEPWGVPIAELNKMPGYRHPKDQDIAEAKSLLQQAGYGDGLEITCVSRSKRWEDQSVFTAAEVAKIGVKLNINILDDATLYTLYEAKPPTYGCTPWSFGQSVLDPDELIGNHWVSGAVRNWFDYYNPKVDELFEEISREMDMVKRQKLVRQAIDIVIFEDYAYAPGVTFKVFWGHNPKIRGWDRGFSNYSYIRHETLWLAK